MEALVAANGLGARDAVLPVGRVLVVPPTGPPSPASAPAPAAAPRIGGEHTVQKGDTLFSLARRYGTSVEALVAANGLGARDAVLPVGCRLVLP